MNLRSKSIGGCAVILGLACGCSGQILLGTAGDGGTPPLQGASAPLGSMDATIEAASGGGSNNDSGQTVFNPLGPGDSGVVNPGSPDDGGTVRTGVVLVDGLVNPSYLAVDDANSTVYFVTADPAGLTGDRVMSVGTDGGAVTMRMAGQGIGYGLFLYQDHVYWTNAGSVIGIPLDGGAPVTIASNQLYPVGPVVDSTGVYWANDLEDAGTVMMAPWDGGAPSVLASGLTWPNSLAINSAGVFWVSLGGISMAPHDGGAPIALSDASNGAIALDSNAVYQAYGCGISRLPLDGEPATVVGNEPPGPIPCNSPRGSIATDGINVYWGVAELGSPGIVEGPGIIVRAPVDATNSTTPTTMASGQGDPNNVALGAGAIYWTNHGLNQEPPGQLMKAPLP